jgi:hypothetical protein
MLHHLSFMDITNLLQRSYGRSAPPVGGINLCLVQARMGAGTPVVYFDDSLQMGPVIVASI